MFNLIFFHLVYFHYIFSLSLSLSLCSARQIQNIADELDEVFLMVWIDRRTGLNAVVTYR